MKLKAVHRFAVLFSLFFLVASFSGCQYCDQQKDGGDQGLGVCGDMDGDGVGVFYPPSLVFRPPATVPCDLALDCDDQNPERAEICGDLLFLTTAPTAVDEGALYNYDVNCLGLSPDSVVTLTVGPGDGCAGALIDNGDGTGNYSFATDEADGPATCAVEIVCAETLAAGVLTATQTTTVTINELNQAPTLDLTCPANLGEDAATTCAIVVADLDLPPNPLVCRLGIGASCVGAVLADCAGPVQVPAQGEAAGPGSCVVEVEVDDGSGGVVTDARTIVIDEVNQAPYFTNVGPTGATEALAYAFAATFADDDLPANPLGCAMVANSCAWLTAVDCAVSGTPTETDGGSSCAYTLRVSDGLASTDQAVNVTVIENDLTPVISNLPATAPVHVGKPGSFDVNAADPDLPPAALTYSINLNGCGFTPAIDAGTGMVTWTCGGIETCALEIKAAQLNGLADLKTLNILCQNIAPAISSTPGNATESSAYSYAITCTDADGDPLTITRAANDTCGGTITFDDGAGNGTYSAWTPTELQGGSQCVVGVRCADAFDAEVHETTIDIIEDNKAPTLNLTCPANLAEDAAGTCAITVADADVPANPLGCGLGAATTCVGAVLADCAGPVQVPAQGEAAGPDSCVVAVEVDDGAGGVTTNTQTITIDEVNQAPYFINVGPTAASEGLAYSYSATYADDDLPPNPLGCALVANSCAWLAAVACAVSGTPTETDGGSSCSYKLRVNDGVVSTDQVVNVTVTEVDSSPAIQNLPATVTRHPGLAGSYDVNAADPDLPPDALTYSINLNGCSFTPTIDAGTGMVTWTCGAAETCAVEIKAGQANGLADLKVLNLICGNSIPVITSTPGPATESSAYIHAITCADGDADPRTLSLTAANTCGGVITVDDGAGNGAYSAWTPTELQGGGSCVVGVRCADAWDAVVQETTINIIEDNKTPTWSAAPTNLCGFQDASYNQANGTATDADVPNGAGSYGYLSCSLSTTTCGFAITVSGAGAGSASPQLAFTASVPGACSATIACADGGGKSVSQAITITVVPKVVRVDSAKTAPGGPGESWATAFSHPQYALNNTCGYQVEVWVKQGTYKRLAAGRGSVLALRPSVSLYGGFSGTETTRASRAAISAKPTILDGEDQSYHVVLGANGATLDGFVITRGNANLAASLDQYGGGLYAYHVSSMTVANCVFDDNYANLGGVIYDNNTAGANLFKNCAFTNNSALLYGGGAYIENGSPTFLNCTFRLNNGGSNGGGISVNGGGVSVINCIFWGNAATSYIDVGYQGSAWITVTYTDIQQTYGGTGNLASDPKFVAGAYGGLYLDQALSPCINVGSDTAANLGLSGFTTATTGAADAGQVDMGYHYSH